MLQFRTCIRNAFGRYFRTLIWNRSFRIRRLGRMDSCESPIKFLRFIPTHYCNGFASGSQPERPNDTSVVDQLSLPDHIFHVRNYYAVNSRINPQELCVLVRRLETESGSNNVPTVDHRDFRFLFSCCTTMATSALRPETLTEMAERIWKVMPKFGVQYDDTLFNSLLNVFQCNRSRRKSVWKLLAEAERLSVSHNRTTQEFLIRLACQQGDMEIGRKLFDSLRTDGNLMSESVYNNLLYGFVKARDYTRFCEIAELLKASGRKWTSSTYTGIMIAYAEIGDTDKLFMTLAEAEKNSILFDDRQLLECVFVLALSGDTSEEHIDKILNRLRHWKFSDLLRLMQRLLSIDRPRIAWHVFAATTKPPDQNDEFAVDVGSFHIRQMFDIKSGLKSIFDICDRLKNSGYHKRPYLEALHAAYENGLEDVAVSIFNRLRNHGYEIRSQYLPPLIILRAKRGANIEEFVDAVWIWFWSNREEDRHDRRLSANFFGVWYWPWTEHARQVRKNAASSSKTEELLRDLACTMDGLVKNGNGVNGNVQATTSGNILTGFVHHCLRKDYSDAIRRALATYPDIQIATDKLKIAITRFLQRTGDKETIDIVLKAAAPGTRITL